MKEKVFAKGFCFFKIFIFFLLGSIFGSLFEEIQWFIEIGTFTCRCDLLYGHFSTLYGFGIVLFLLILVPRNNQRGFMKTFFYSFFLGGIFEYFAGLFSEKILNIKFWDYSTMFLNINGKTTIPIMTLVL